MWPTGAAPDVAYWSSTQLSPLFVNSSPPMQAVAFGKLQGILNSAPLTLPGKNQINLGLLAGILATGGLFLTSDDPSECCV